MTNTPQLKTAKVADLKPAERNARTHSPEQIKQIAASIEQFGPGVVAAAGSCHCIRPVVLKFVRSL